MSKLKDQIYEDLITSMKAKNELRTSVLRMLKAEIMKFEVAGEKKEATDENVLEIVQKLIKQRKDSEEQFRKGDREELADKEAKEIEELLPYLPPQLTEDEIHTIVQKALESTGASSKADMGKVMGAVMPQVKGKSDGNIVKKVVMELLP